MQEQEPIFEKYFYDDFPIIAESEEEAEEVLDALQIVHEYLDNAELIALARVIEEKPELVPYLRQMIENPPAWVKLAQNCIPTSVIQKFTGENEE